MPLGLGLPSLSGAPFEVRYSEGCLERAQTAVRLAAGAYDYFRRLFSGVAPDIALLVLRQSDWPDATPYGLPFFRDEPDEIRPGILVMSDGGGDFWAGMVHELIETSPAAAGVLRAAYPDGAGGINLQPYFDLITVHELAHAFEVLGDLRLPTAWLSEIFVNVALHTFVATQCPARLPTLDVLATVGSTSPRLDARMRAEGLTTLEELEVHYTGGENPMSPTNYAWYQYRWQRLAARMFDADGEAGLIRFWSSFHAVDRVAADGSRTASSLAPLLAREVSRILGHAVAGWPQLGLPGDDLSVEASRR